MNQNETKIWESMKNYVNSQIERSARISEGGGVRVDVTPITAARIKEICTHTGEHIGVSLETSDVKSKITLTSNFTLNRATLFKFGNVGTIEMNLTTTSSFSKDAQFKLFSVSNSWIKAGVVSGSNLSGAINVSGNAWVTTQTNLNSGSSIDVVASVALA